MGSTLSWPASRKRPPQSKLGDKLAPKFNKTLERLFAFAFCAFAVAECCRGGVPAAGQAWHGVMNCQ